jgi:parallel beta-helix repeat protein
MKSILFTILFLSVNLFAQYTTPNSSVVWTLDSLVQYSAGLVTGSFPNYTISGKITVSTNDRIIIPAGSRVTFSAINGGFDVNGIFQAMGTPTDSIIFTATVPDSQGYYEGFRFNANPQSNQSIIKYARIFYADYGMRCIDASPELSNSYLFKCLRGVQLSTSNAIIKNNVIERSYEYGITMTLSSSPLIEGNHLIKNNTRATSAMNQINIGLQGNNSPIIRDNIIEGGESIPTGGISLWVNGSTAFSNSIIEGNTIFNNSFGITLYSTSNGIINTIVRNNTIYNNRINPNTQTSGSGININGSPFNQPLIKNNRIYNNWWGITIQNGTTVQAGPQPKIGNVENTDTTDDGQNIIYNNAQGSNVYDLYNNCTNDIFAQNNDWGVYDSVSIEQNIYHKVDNPQHGLVKFVPFSLQIPVEFVSFNYVLFGNNVELNWVTATETNNSGFEVQRFYQGKWEAIGFVVGNGTTSQISEYRFVDGNLSEGKYYYRLKQIDFDGKFKFSKQIEVDILNPKDFILYQNYPNPFNPSTTISWQSPVSGHHTIKLFDVLGREIETIVDGYYEAGKHSTLYIVHSTLPSGVYFFQLIAENFVETKKMILMR